MANKEKFNVEGSALFGDMSRAEVRDAVTRRPGRPANDVLVREHGAQNGLPAELTRQTFIVSVDQIEKLCLY